ncbi:phage major capsid protein, partial [Bacillus velezensis]
MPVAMTKKERELRQKFTQKKQEASNLLEDGKPEEARSMLEEAKELQSQIELMTEGRSLELPEIGEERNFSAEIKSEPKKETEDRNILTATKEYREAWLKVLTG